MAQHSFQELLEEQQRRGGGSFNFRGTNVNVARNPAARGLLELGDIQNPFTGKTAADFGIGPFPIEDFRKALNDIFQNQLGQTGAAAGRQASALGVNPGSRGAFVSSAQTPLFQGRQQQELGLLQAQRGEQFQRAALDLGLIESAAAFDLQQIMTLILGSLRP